MTSSEANLEAPSKAPDKASDLLLISLQQSVGQKTDYDHKANYLYNVMRAQDWIVWMQYWVSFLVPPTMVKRLARLKARPGFVLNWLDCYQAYPDSSYQFTFCSTYHLLCVSGIATLEASGMPEVKARIACIVWNATDWSWLWRPKLVILIDALMHEGR